MLDTGEMDVAAVAVRLAGVAGQVGRLGATGLPPRATSSFGPIITVDLGVATPWAVQAFVPDDLARSETLAAALAWCRDKSGERGFRVNAREAQLDRLADLGLTVHERLGVYAMPSVAAHSLVVGAPVLDIGHPRSRDELVSAYGGWMSDVPLAHGLVTSDDLKQPSRRFLVGRVDGQPVGCALVWFAGGTACLSGIGIVPEARRRGYGRALTAAAAKLGATGAGGTPPDLVWMHATREGAALYAAMGFEHVDVHVLLGPETAGGEIPA